MAGHEVVFGQFEQKAAAGIRRLGSKLIGVMNNRIFGKPADLVVSNFRILRRDVVDRIVASRTAYPYITGQALMFSGDRANVLVRHDPRPVGKSNYSLVRIMRLVLTILFSYSSWPLRAAADARLRDLRPELPARRVPGRARAGPRHGRPRLDVDDGAGRAVLGLHHRADLDDR